MNKISVDLHYGLCGDKISSLMGVLSVKSY